MSIISSIIDQQATVSCHDVLLDEEHSSEDGSSCDTTEFDDAFSELQPARVRFVESLVTETRYRPRTLPEEKAQLFYQEEDMKRFRAEYVALRQAHRQRKMELEQQKIASQPTKTLLSRIITYVFTLEEPSLSSARLSSPNSSRTAELLYTWDLGLVSGSF